MLSRELPSESKCVKLVTHVDSGSHWSLELLAQRTRAREDTFKSCRYQRWLGNTRQPLREQHRLGEGFHGNTSGKSALKSGAGSAPGAPQPEGHCRPARLERRASSPPCRWESLRLWEAGDLPKDV